MGCPAYSFDTTEPTPEPTPLYASSNNLRPAIEEINYLRSILLMIAWPANERGELNLDILDVAQAINTQRTLRSLLPIDSLSEIHAQDISPIGITPPIAKRPKYYSQYIGYTDIVPGSDEEMTTYEQRSRDHERENNTDHYRRGRSTARARKKQCQWCGCGTKPKAPDALGRVHSGLNVHHLVPITSGGSVHDGLVTLCNDCHLLVHTIDGGRDWRHVNPEMTEQLKAIATYL